MGQVVYISQSLHCGTHTEVELPKDYTWDGVKDFYVKWDRLHLNMKDGSNHEIELNSDVFDSIDWKRPNSVEVYGCDEEDEIDYWCTLGEYLA